MRAVISRDTERVSGRFSVPVVGSIDFHPPEPILLILAVPDSAIEATSRDLASSMENVQLACVIHTSGSLPSSILAPFRSHGAPLLSLHPITSFPATDSEIDPFEGCVVSLEGTPTAREIGRSLVDRIRATPIEVTPDQKNVIHVAASIAANFSTTLASVADHLLSNAAVESHHARTILATLLRSVAENLSRNDPSEALTGPIVRGDVEIVRRHLDTLGQGSEADVHLYRVLGLRTVELARESMRLSVKDAGLISDILRSGEEADNC